MDSYKIGIRICVINVWFGGLPSYLNYFHRTCVTNRNIDWILVSDQEFNLLSSENVSHIAMSKQAFANLATEKLGFDVTVQDPYKVCDFKPLFGKIFEDQLKNYQYWGYCDLDIIFGDLPNYIIPILDENPDIISFYPGFLSGPFCLYRNSSNINELFRNYPGFQDVLQNPEHHAFDEHIPRKLSCCQISFYRMFYLLRLIIAGPRYQFRIQEIRYQFQWYLKKKLSEKYPASDMTEVVYKANRKKQIKVIFKDLIKSDRAFMRWGRESWTISLQDGRLFDIKNGEDVFAFHFVDSKNDPAFEINSRIDEIINFSISNLGIECHE